MLREWVGGRLASGDPEAVREAAEVVGTLRMRSCADLLVVALDRVRDDRARETICRALVTIDPVVATGAILRLLTDDAPTWVGDLMAIAIARGGPTTRSREAVEARVVDGDVSRAVLRLVDGPTEATAPVIRAVLESDDIGLRAIGLRLVAGASELRPWLAEVRALLDDDDPGIRAGAARALETHAHRVASRPRRPPRTDQPGVRGAATKVAVAGLVQRLVLMLGDDDRNARFAAAAALAAIDPEGDLIRPVADGTDPVAAETARVALLLLGGPPAPAGLPSGV